MEKEPLYLEGKIRPLRDYSFIPEELVKVAEK